MLQSAGSSNDSMCEGLRLALQAAVDCHSWTNFSILHTAVQSDYLGNVQVSTPAQLNVVYPSANVAHSMYAVAGFQLVNTQRQMLIIVYIDLLRCVCGLFLCNLIREMIIQWQCGNSSSEIHVLMHV